MTTSAERYRNECFESTNTTNIVDCMLAYDSPHDVIFDGATLDDVTLLIHHFAGSVFNTDEINSMLTELVDSSHRTTKLIFVHGSLSVTASADKGFDIFYCTMGQTAHLQRYPHNRLNYNTMLICAELTPATKDASHRGYGKGEQFGLYKDDNNVTQTLHLV